jgi:hypothetical protein
LQSLERADEGKGQRSSDTRRDRDVAFTDWFSGLRHHVVARSFNLGQDALRMCEKLPARFGWNYAPTGSFEQLFPKLILEGLNLPTQRRLPNGKEVLCLRKAPELRDMRKIPQLLEIHGFTAWAW